METVERPKRDEVDRITRKRLAEIIPLASEASDEAATETIELIDRHLAECKNGHRPSNGKERQT